MEKLKPCPFCGGVAYFSELKAGNWGRYSVVCANDRCFASKSSCFGKRYYTKKEAAEAWNRRATMYKAGDKIRNRLKKIDAPKVEKELHIGDEVVAATGRLGVVVDCHVPNLDGEDKYAVCFANEIVECSRQVLAKTDKHYNTFTEYLREVRNG